MWVQVATGYRHDASHRRAAGHAAEGRLLCQSPAQFGACASWQGGHPTCKLQGVDTALAHPLLVACTSLDHRNHWQTYPDMCQTAGMCLPIIVTPGLRYT